jgi:serine/threonine-protein kinase RsbW
MHKRFQRTIASLQTIFDFIDDFVTAYRIDDSSAFAISIMVEELFTNMVKHNPHTVNDVAIDLQREGATVRITLTDSDVEPFDLTAAEEVDVRESLDNRKPGGLGIHLVKNLADDIRYEYKNRQSKITLIKKLEREHV